MEDELQTNFQFKIGLEIHLALNTEYKAFSVTKIADTSYTSLGLIGTLPQINTSAIKSAYKMAWALNTVIPKELTFERKSYFYFDLPRGYQLTQHSNPIGKGGYIFLPNLKQKISISSVALEEDTAAHSSYDGPQKNYQLSLQRLGVPLIEIVTEPELKSAEEAIECVKIIRFLSFLLKLSKAELESGQLRVDLNVSLVDEYGEARTGRAEIKNLASYKAIEQATTQIKKHFIEKMTKGEEDIFANETFSWIESESRLVRSRSKMSEADYLFIPESCIPAIKLSVEEKEELIFEANQDQLNNAIKGIESSKLAERERQEIVAGYDFFWECYRVQQILKDWANSYFVLKIFQSIKGSEKAFENLVNFLTKLVEELYKSYRITEFKFNNWKIRECCKKLISPMADIEQVVEFYLSLPTIGKEQIVELCHTTIDKEKDELKKIVEKEDKLTNYLLGVVKTKYKEQVEMAEAKQIVDMKLKSFIERINSVEEIIEEEKEEEPQFSTDTIWGKMKQQRLERKKALEAQLKAWEEEEKRESGELDQSKEVKEESEDS